MLNRRQFAASLTTALLGTVALPLTPSAANQSSGLRGSIDVSPYELVPGSTIDQGHCPQRAAARCGVCRPARCAAPPATMSFPMSNCPRVSISPALPVRRG